MEESGGSVFTSSILTCQSTNRLSKPDRVSLKMIGIDINDFKTPHQPFS